MCGSGESASGLRRHGHPGETGDLSGRVARSSTSAKPPAHSVECCLLIGRPPLTIVGQHPPSAGNAPVGRRGAPPLAPRKHLQQDAESNGALIRRDALRMATTPGVPQPAPQRVVLEAGGQEFQSGEGANPVRPEAIARSMPLLPPPSCAASFSTSTSTRAGASRPLAQLHHPEISAPSWSTAGTLWLKSLRPKSWELISTANLAEIHLNRIDPSRPSGPGPMPQGRWLRWPACSSQISVERYRQAAPGIPIVGVSFTGLFDFSCMPSHHLAELVAGRAAPKQKPVGLKAQGSGVSEPLEQWEHGGGGTTAIANGPAFAQSVAPPCTRPAPRACSARRQPGWHLPRRSRFHPPHATFRKNDPVALACLDSATRIVQANCGQDDHGSPAGYPSSTLHRMVGGNPTASELGRTSLAADAVEITLSPPWPFDFYMQVQTHYTAHNTICQRRVSARERNRAVGERSIQAIDGGQGLISQKPCWPSIANATFRACRLNAIDQALPAPMSEEVLKPRRTGEFSFEALQALTTAANWVDSPSRLL